MGRNGSPPKGQRPIPSSASPPPRRYVPGQIEADRIELERRKSNETKSDWSWLWAFLLLK